MHHQVVGRPASTEFAPHYDTYIKLIQSDDIVAVLAGQISESLYALRGVSESDSLKRYEPGKWSVREILGHMIDAERIFAYRALRFARSDKTELEGFEQDPYVVAALSDKRAWTDLLAEFELSRKANVLMFRGLQPEDWMQSGVASKAEISVRALAYVIAGHELHHMAIIRSHYLRQG
jgi:uncharacterized damage-inducible protein DinB